MKSKVFEKMVKSEKLMKLFGGAPSEGIPIYFVKPFSNCSDEQFSEIITRIEKEIPVRLFEYVDAISVIDFLKMSDSITSYLDGDSIYISSTIGVDEIYNSIVHEAAHSYLHRIDICSNYNLVQEFLQKRKYVYEDLAANNMLYGLSYHDFMNSYYDKKVDLIVTKKIGYDKIRERYSDLYVSPQSMLSLEEYYCCATEYFFNDELKIQSICPILADVLKELFNE